jgi:hypothetical protein
MTVLPCAVLIGAALGLVACAPNEGAAVPPGEPVPAASAPPSTPSDVGGPCWVSLVRTVDGKPSAEQACKPELKCDYTGAVPDGPGRCAPR